MTLDFNTDTEQGRKKIEEEFNRLYQNAPHPVPPDATNKPSNALLALLALVILCLIVYVAL